MIVADTRTGVQVAAATGSAEKADWGLGGVLGGAGSSSGAVLGLGAYENTAEGKVVAASFLDNYNQVVRAVRNQPQLQRASMNVAQETPPPQPPVAVPQVPAAPAGFTRGDVLRGKIGGVKVYAQPSEKSRVVATLARGDEVLFTGQERDGFLNVQRDKATGWVEKDFVVKVQ